MDIIKKLKDFCKGKFTFVVIPHNGKSTKQFAIPKTLIYLTLTFFTTISIFLMCSTLYLFYENGLLSGDLEVKMDKIDRLNDIVDRQHVEIKDLKSTSEFVIGKLAQLHELESKIRNMVGLSSDEEKKENSTVSRSLDLLSMDFDAIKDHDYYQLTSLTETESVDAITNLIESQKENYDHLIKDVEKQLKYLESRPDKWPIIGRISSYFGYRKDPFTRRRSFHNGIDIANRFGLKVTAAGSGIVTYSGWNGNYGRVIIISHGYGYKSVYAHNNKNLVKVGDKVKKGQAIAHLGSTGRSTGPHLHFEIRYNGQHINPLKVLENK